MHIRDDDAQLPLRMQRLLVATRLHRSLAIEGGIAAQSLFRA